MAEPTVTGSGESVLVIDRSAVFVARQLEEEFCGLLVFTFNPKSLALLLVSVPLPDAPPGFLS